MKPGASRQSVMFQWFGRAAGPGQIKMGAKGSIFSAPVPAWPQPSQRLGMTVLRRSARQRAQPGRLHCTA